jgi:hypothetical protein
MAPFRDETQGGIKRGSFVVGKKEFTWTMAQDKNHIEDKLVIIVAWMIALSLVILVYMKFKLLFHLS